MKSAVAEYHQQPPTMIAGAGRVTPSGAGLMSQVHDDLDADDDDPRPEPTDLFVDLGMLILEGRKPERSVKGRVEGEHCPPRYPNDSRHQCTPDMVARCKQIEAAHSYICFLCLNNIPMSVEVLLYPDCCLEDQEDIEMMSSIEETAQALDQPSSHLLLEQWIVQLLPKRFPDGHCHSHLLFQAVRSFLHFSQISAWLSSTQGRLPKNIVYRVCAPGESFPTSFSSTPEVHTFPILNLSKSSSLRVTVASLPRTQTIPVLPCYNAEHSDIDGTIGKGRGDGKEKDDDDDDREFRYAFVNPSRERDQRSGEELKEERRQKHDQRVKQGSSAGAASLPAVQEEKMRQRNATAAQKLRVLLPEPRDASPVRPEKKGPRLPKLRDNSPQHARRVPLKPTSCDNLPPRPPSVELEEKQVTAKLKRQQVEDSNRGKHTPTCELYYVSGQPSFSTVELERRIRELKLQKLQERSSTGSPECVTSTPPPSRGESTPRPICAWKDRTPSLEEDDGIFFTAKSSLEDRGFAVQDVFRTSNRYDKEDEDVPATEFGTPLSTVPWLSYHKSTDSDSGNQGHIHCDSQPESVFVGNQPKHGFSGTDTPTSCSQSPAKNGNLLHKMPEMQSRHYPNAIRGAEPVGHDASSSSNQPLSQVVTAQNQWTTDQVQGAYSHLGCSPSQNQNNQSPSHLNQSSTNAISGNTPSPTSSPRHARRRGFSLDSHDFQPNIPAPFRKPMQYEGNSDNTSTSASSPFTPVFGRSKSLFRSVLGKENNSRSKEGLAAESIEVTSPPTLSGLRSGLMRRSLDSSNTYVFNPSTGLPINSSPAPLRKAKTEHDCASLLKPRSLLKSSPSCNDLENSNTPLSHATRVFSTSAPASTSCLLGNFEESVLNGRLEPLGTIDGFTAEIGASGSFCPKHIILPVTTFFYSVSDDDAPSSYFGYINLERLGRRGYHIPKVGTIQATLFNPNKTVVKMFVMRYNLADMPPNCQTFARQRIFYMPSNAQLTDDCEKELRYLIHIRFQSSKSGKIYLHTDIRMIFARHSPDLESALGTYELRSFTETPTNPRFSPKKR
ncbi:protein FAM214A-like [Patiria miniata]|uniref:Atos-like conserved domain-containing protein n=1 Tax=Patiria miniata TaxID=46514 RepID=A0A914A3Y6_PATMI|nr:protein FAM214A-like [Patiria miniata]